MNNVSLFTNLVALYIFIIGDPTRVPDVRDIVDWDYYRERLGSAIQKIITIPAAMQRVDNPVPRVRHPDWLHRKVAEKEDTHKQTKLDTLFAAAGAKKAAQQAQQPAMIGDLEDFGRSPGPGGAGTAAQVGIASRVEVTPAGGPSPVAGAGAGGVNGDGTTPTNAMQGTTDVEIEEVLAAPTPLRHESFSGWLAAKKDKWRLSRKERKRQREAAGGDGRRQRQRTEVGVTGMFAQQAEAAASAAWQIVSLAPTPQAGIYKAWVVINGRMHAIPLRIPRTFYVDAVLPPGDPALAPLQTAGAIVQLVRRTLPGGADAHYTHQVTMPESEYRADLQQLEAVVSHPGIRGVFEARVPPEWTAALSTGCVAVVAPGAQRRNLGAGFDLKELQAKPVVQYGYFSSLSSSAHLRHMTLHHSEDAARGRAVYALHVPADGVCHVWVVNPARGGQREVTTAVMDRSWNEARDMLSAELQQRDAEEEAVELLEAPRCEVVYARSSEAALKGMQKLLTRIK